jgi:hypothetical protein
MGVAAVLMISAFFTGCYMFSKSDTYYGVKTTGKKIVFVVDISGSMEGRNEGNVSDKLRAEAANRAGDMIGSKIGGQLGGFVSGGIKKQSTKLASAKRELQPAIRGLDESSMFTIIAFESGVDFWKDRLVEASSGNKTLGTAYVSNLSSKGGTSALKGLQAAFSIKGVNMIFFLSDGFPSDAPGDRILQEVKKMNPGQKVSINSIGLGDDKDPKFMKALAEENNGVYVER